MTTITVVDQGDCQFDGQFSLMEALDENGFDINYSCRSGHCGACVAKLVSGEVEEIQSGSYDVEKDEILTCSVIPIGDVVIEMI